MTTHADEIARRRTFAIISHPDAGKTTSSGAATRSTCWTRSPKDHRALTKKRRH
jgi:hypothetical protein